MSTLRTALVGIALALSSGLTAYAQESVPAAEAEGTNLWFVELAGPPTADGARLSDVRSEKAAFRKAAATAGVEYEELNSFDVLFNGFSVKAGPAQRAVLGSLPGVKAMWPIEIIEAPEPPEAGGYPNLATAIEMTGAHLAHASGYTGAGIRVAVMDSGIDYDHADLGGDGIARSNSPMFPNSRVVAGWDFVGDAFTAGLTPEPDAFPDDCGGHGTHVSGIVGANGVAVGVAPDVSFGAYRVFGCDGSTSADIMLAAMERALADGMQVLNMSIGSRAQWPQYPTGAAATRLQNLGMIVVASIGNNGPGGSAPDGPYAAGAPGVGHDVIGVASFDNVMAAAPAFTVNPGNHLVGFNRASGAVTTPTSGTVPFSSPNPATGCAAADYAGFPAGHAALVVRGGCPFRDKALNAEAAGAAAAVIYNNGPGALNPTVAGATLISIPTVGILQADGQLIASIAGATLTWGTQTVSAPVANGGMISGFSSYGMAADLTLKPDIGAPGGSIFSTIPLEQGGHGSNSGTSMSAPHVAGAVALLLQADPAIAPGEVRARLQNSAEPRPFSLVPGFIESAHRQGAGLLQITDAISATVDVTPGKLSLGESEAGPQTRQLTIRNRGNEAVTLNLSKVDAVATGPKARHPSTFQTVSYWAPASTADFSATSVTVAPGGTATVDVTISAPDDPDPGLLLGQYGGYIVLTEDGSGRDYSVPFAGFIGDYQQVPVLTAGRTSNGYPWLAQRVGTAYSHRPNGQAYTMEGDDVPFFLVHLDHHSRSYAFHVSDAATGAPVHPVFANFDEGDWVPRNTTATGFFAFAWDGTRIHSAGNPDLRHTLPNGDYIVELRVLKALGDEHNPDHWETWTSPVVTIARPTAPNGNGPIVPPGKKKK
jgi:minor extracellular serine protease Vpr